MLIMKRLILCILFVVSILPSTHAQTRQRVKALSNGIEYVEYAIDFPASMRLVRTKDTPPEERLFGLVDSLGNELTPCVWTKIYAPREGRMRVQQGRDESMRTGYLDMQGATVIAPDWEDGTNFSDGWAAVQRDGKWGYIDPNGQVVMQPVYAHAYAPRGDYLIVGQQGKYYVKYGMIKRSGELVIPMDYYSITYFKTDRAIVGKIIGGAPRYGLIDTQNQVVLPLEWDFLSITDEGNAWVGKGQYPNSVYTLLDRSGNRMITTDLYDLDSSGKFGHCKAAVRDGNGNLHYGVVSSTGKVIIPFQYDLIMIFTEHHPELGEVAVVSADKDGKRFSFTLSVK